VRKDRLGKLSECASVDGVVAKVKDVAHKEMLLNHFITHRGHLAAKKLPTDFKYVLGNAGKNVNELEVDN